MRRWGEVPYCGKDRERYCLGKGDAVGSVEIAVLWEGRKGEVFWEE